MCLSVIIPTIFPSSLITGSLRILFPCIIATASCIELSGFIEITLVLINSLKGVWVGNISTEPSACVISRSVIIPIGKKPSTSLFTITTLPILFSYIILHTVCMVWSRVAVITVFVMNLETGVDRSKLIWNYQLLLRTR
jgi:hypothetical protein